MRLHISALVFIVLTIGGLGWQKSLAQSDQEQYFDETGHRVTGEFLNAYKNVSNPLLLYGYPITDAYQDPTTNNLVQYFQKARFELYPEAPIGQRVQLAPLGYYLYVSGQGQPLRITDSSPACQTFLESGFKVCYAFLAFFIGNGGEAQFGQPVSNTEIQNNYMVQYFERARFEWHPELRTGQRVVLSNLGTQYFYFHGENPARLLPEPGSDTNAGVLSLRAHAFPLKAVTGAQGHQTVNIIIQDQRFLPVSDATVSIVVRMPSGQETRYIVPTPTNSQGITHYEFPFSSNAIGVAEIQISVLHGNLKGQTVTSFRIWW